jgi:hypothetical protein
MTYRTILLDLTADGPVEARLDVARSLASRFGAALIGMHVSPPPLQLAAWQGGMSVYIPPEVVEAQRKANQEAKERVRAAFDRVRGDDPTAEWREAEGDPGQLLAEAAHAADLVVTAGGGGSPDVAERLVTATGVPVLALPPGAARDLGRVVLVAWKGSPEAARAVHDALPFLQTAERVVLCAVGERSAAGLDAAAAMLGRHQVRVRPEREAAPTRARARSCWRRPPRTAPTSSSWAPTGTRGCASSSSAAPRAACCATRRCPCSSAADRNGRSGQVLDPGPASPSALASRVSSPSCSRWARSSSSRCPERIRSSFSCSPMISSSALRLTS